jgi:hypothetical protein
MFGACGSGGNGGAGGSAGGTGKVDGGSGGSSGSTLDANVPDGSIQFEVGAADGNRGAGGSAGGTGKVDGGSGGSSGSTLDANVPDGSIQSEVGAAGGNGGAGGSAGGTGKVDGGSGGSSGSTLDTNVPSGGSGGSTRDASGADVPATSDTAIALDSNALDGSGGTVPQQCLTGLVDARADLVLHAVMRGGAFGTVDVQTGVFTQTGTMSGYPEDLARLPGGALYAQLDTQDLVIVDPATAKSTLVGNTGNGILVIKFRRDGVLFGASHTDLYRIDKTTAQATHVGAFGVPYPSNFDISFDDQNNLYMTQDSGTLYKVDVATGVASAIGPTGFAMNALDFDQCALYGFTLDSKIITINTSTGIGTFLANVSPASPVIYGIATMADAP